MPNWNNYIMRKYGQSIRRNIHEALIGSTVRAFAVKKRAEHEQKNRERIEATVEYIKHKAEGGRVS